MRLVVMRRMGLVALVAAFATGAVTPAHADPESRLTAGFAHACGVANVRTVVCWGLSDHGQLGSRVTIDPFEANPIPLDVPGTGDGVQGVVAGLFHVCAVVADGDAVRCWGGNSHGQLGTGDTTERTTPAQVAMLPADIGDLAAGKVHTCVSTQGGGQVLCWGHNEYGQLGNGQPGCDPANPFRCQSLTPVVVDGLSGVKQLTAGDAHTCALTAAGAVYCWGANYYGQLGIGGPVGDGQGRTKPVAVPGLGSGVRSVSAGGDHTCAITRDEAIECWGHNSFGQLGDGTTKDRASPVRVALKGAEQIVSGFDHTCIVATKGGVACWGRNQLGELGDGTEKDRHRPVPVAGLGRGTHPEEIVAGYQYTCALLRASDVSCWGKNQFGQLGDATTTNRSKPVATLFACFAMTATIYAKPGVPTQGTAGDDVIMGTAGDDTINGNGGSDAICGLDGNDTIRVGKDASDVSGGPGNDHLVGGPGRDSLNGGPGADRIEGGHGNDVIDGDAGDDKLRGEGDNDTLFGGDGNDLLLGGDRHDTLYGSDGIDALDGGGGGDTIFGGDDDDLLVGAPGEDTLDGEDGDDHLVGAGATDKLIGGPGDDNLNGGPGRDRLEGRDGDDLLVGGADPDRLFGGPDDDHLFGNGGRDLLTGGPGTDHDDGGGDGDHCVGEFFVGCAVQHTPG